MSKTRKTLNDALAQQFVYGQKEDTPPLPPSELPRESKVQKRSSSSFIDKLQNEAAEPTKRFTIDLASSLHRKLSLLSARTGKSKADIVRVLLSEALQDVED